MLEDIIFRNTVLSKVCSQEQTLVYVFMITAAPCRKLRARACYLFKCAPVSRLHFWLKQKLRRLTKSFQGLRARRTPCPTLRLGRALKLDGFSRSFSGEPENLRSAARTWSIVWQPLSNRKLLGGLPTLDRRALVTLAISVAFGKCFFDFFIYREVNYNE